ncbi:hypothetical protein EVJ58_g4912 [Rhodofomes roseus]|uniref:GH18 domain-containing protein n=1 Tax=Rhodofomes roseus TaxID=34475 RepID=A0A4Y9YEM6_9APHY|nr:hypothetical protein EVJ58_g4912 [Rhodofomes roseus]
MASGSNPEAIFFLPPDGAQSASSSTSSTVQASSTSIESSSAAGTPSSISVLNPTTSTTSTLAPSPTASTQGSSAASPSSAPTPLVMGYYPDWAAPAFPPEKIDFGRFDWIDFAFAVPDQSYNLTWDGSDAAPDLLERLVTVAHDSGKKVKLSVGGWTGSQYFSPAVSDAASRQTFASNIRAFYDAFDLDGVDIDWEYPGQGGNDGNVVSPDDTSNFLSFLQLLRATLPSDAKMSAAVQTVPFADASGNPLGDVSAFAQVLDWVLIMNYDAWGSSKTPGPNAPLSDACHNSTQPVASAAAAVRAWTSAGFPVDQLVLGGALVRIHLPIDRDAPPPTIAPDASAALAWPASAKPAPHSIVARAVDGGRLGLGHGGLAQ